MKDLWRWLKLEWQYSNTWQLCDALVISLLWIIVGVETWRDNYSNVLVYCLMIIAWKLSFSKHV